MANFIKEFKEFALKGNVMDMAIGVIIGGAFGKIVTSVVGDLIMPLFAAMGGLNTTDLKVVLKPGVEEVVDKAGNVVTPAVEEIAWTYGVFVQNVIDFLIIAICLFVVIKIIAAISAKFKKEEAEAPAPAPEPSAEEKLLSEIRDILKEK